MRAVPPNGLDVTWLARPRESEVADLELDIVKVGDGTASSREYVTADDIRSTQNGMRPVSLWSV